MTSNWETVRLGEVATQYVESFAVMPDEEYINLGVKWYAEGVFARDPKLGSAIKGSKLFRVKPGQFIYNKMFATEGSFALVPGELASGVVSNEFPVFDLDESVIVPEYLAFYFQQRNVWEFVAQECVGTTKSRSRWKEERFLTHQIFLPPLSEQRRIVDLIGSLDETIDVADDVFNRVKELKASAVESQLNGGPSVSIGSISDVSQGRGLPKEVQGLVSGDCSWFKIADMTTPKNMFGYTEAATRMTAEQVKGLGGRLAAAGSVVFPRVGAAVLTEKKRILETDSALDENHIVLTPKPGIPAELLLGALEMLRLGNLVQPGAVPSLNMKLIRETIIPWANPDQLKVIDDLCAAARIMMRESSAHATYLRKLRGEILTSLLSGAHTIPETYDEVMTMDEDAPAMSVTV